MHKIHLDTNIKKVHFIGIGGVSMSGLAEILHKYGYIITGSDQSPSKVLEHLESLSIKTTKSHSKENITSDIDLVVYTAAIKSDNAELIEAKEKNIKLMDRAELLGLIMKSYKYPISIAGTHGKTSTTSMISEIFLHGNLDPTITVGGFYPPINGNFKMGDSEYFIVESCEYCDSFLKFYPFIGIILNVEADHLDYFKDLDQIMGSFNKFAKNIPVDGNLIINNMIKDVDTIIRDLKCNIITFGNESANWQAKDINYCKMGLATFNAYFNGENMGSISLRVPGYHNVLNALSACASAYVLGVPMQTIVDGINNFYGINRRFQFKGIVNNITVIDDYAHHPTEIKATLKAAKNFNYNKLWCVFQPHTYTRTKSLLDEFALSFDDADNIIIVDIYSAREKDTGIIHSKDLVKKLISKGKNAIYAEDFEVCQSILSNNCIHNDLLITMGAGDVYIIGDTMLHTDLSTLSTDF